MGYAEKGSKEWHKYVDTLIEENGGTPKEIFAVAAQKYPTINQSTLYYYITHCGARKRARTDRGYSCPNCGSIMNSIRAATYHGDHTRRVRKCECGYTWTTIELDEDMFKRLTK